MRGDDGVVLLDLFTTREFPVTVEIVLGFLLTRGNKAGNSGRRTRPCSRWDFTVPLTVRPNSSRYPTRAGFRTRERALFPAQTRETDSLGQFSCSSITLSLIIVDGQFII